METIAVSTITTITFIFYKGCAQVVVLGPCTFLVTAAVTGGDKPVSVYTHTLNTYRTRGIAGFYHGGTALILRQGRVVEEESMLECWIMYDDGDYDDASDEAIICPCIYSCFCINIRDITDAY